MAAEANASHASAEQSGGPAKPFKVRLREDPELWPRYRKARTLTIVGGATMGGSFALVLTGGLVWVIDAMAEGPITLGPTIATFTLVGLGGAALVAGTAMLGVGLHRRKQIVREARMKYAVTPWFGPGGGGAALTLRW